MEREALIPLSEAKIRMHEIVRDLPKKPALLLRHGKPVAAMIDFEAYEALLEQIADLEDRLSVAQAREVPVEDRLSWDKVKAEGGLH